MADTNKKFLDSAGLSYLWGKIKDNFANKLNYDSSNGLLYLTDGLGNPMELSIDTRHFGALAVSTYDMLSKYLDEKYIGLTLYITSDITNDVNTWERGAYIVTGANSLMKLATTTSSGDVAETVAILEGRVTTAETNITALNSNITSINSEIDALQAFQNNVYTKSDVYTKSEVDALIPVFPDVVFKSVDSNDKVLALNDGVLSSSINLVREGNALVLSGKDNEPVATVDITDFVVDGMIESVNWSDVDDNKLVITFNTSAGKEDIEVDFGKYVDAYRAGEGIKLENNTFSIDTDTIATIDNVNTTISNALQNCVFKQEGKDLSSNDLTDDLLAKLNAIEAGAQVNVVKSVDTSSILSLSEEGVLSANVDMSNYWSKSELSVITNEDIDALS